MGKKPSTMVANSDAFCLVLWAIMGHLPSKHRVDPSVPWVVREALIIATFNEWTRFEKRNFRDILYSSSQDSQKTGGRDAHYARVNNL